VVGVFVEIQLKCLNLKRLLKYTVDACRSAWPLAAIWASPMAMSPKTTGGYRLPSYVVRSVSVCSLIRDSDSVTRLKRDKRRPMSQCAEWVAGAPVWARILQ